MKIDRGQRTNLAMQVKMDLVTTLPGDAPTAGGGIMSKPVRLVLACLVCLAVITGAVLLYQELA